MHQWSLDEVDAQTMNSVRPFQVPVPRVECEAEARRCSPDTEYTSACEDGQWTDGLIRWTAGGVKGYVSPLHLNVKPARLSTMLAM